MNSKQYEPAISGWLFIYTLYLILCIACPLIPIFSFFLSSMILLIPFNILCLILIYRKSRYAKVLNLITLSITICSQLIVMRALNNIETDAIPGFITESITVIGTVSIAISAIFIGYWLVSKRVKSVFTTKPEDGSTQSVINNPTSVAGGSAVPNINQQADPVHFAILTTLSLISSGIFVLTGFGALFFIPIALIFAVVYSVIFSFVLKRVKEVVYATYTVLFTLIFSYISILLNCGIVSDGPDASYLLPSVLQIPSAGFDHLFGSLLQFSIWYLLLSIPLNIILIRNNARKISLSIIPLIALILIVIHVLSVYMQAPALRSQAAAYQQQDAANEQRVVVPTRIIQ